MHLAIKQRNREGITILDLKGRIVLGEEDSSLRNELQSLLDAEIKTVILNLKEISQLDSAAIGTMVYFTKEFRDAGGRLALLTPSHTELPEVIQLKTKLESYRDELDAVNSFFPDRKVAHYDILEFVEHLEREKAEESTTSTNREEG